MSASIKSGVGEHRYPDKFNPIQNAANDISSAAATFRLFGASTWSAKLWSCLFAFGGCLLTFAIARRLFGPSVALMAGVMMAAMPGVSANAIDCRLDSAVTLYVLLAVYGALRAADDERPAWLLLAGVVGGLGALTKASTLVHVPALTVAVIALRRPRALLHPWLLAAAVLAVALAAPWHVAMLARHGGAYTDTYFRGQITSRMTAGAHLLGNLGMNLGVVVVLGLPWSPLGGVAVARWSRATAAERRGLVLALVWVGWVVVSMAVPPKRYDRYVIQAYPAVALLAAFGLRALLPERVRAALPAFLRTLVIVQVFVLATLPIKLHSYRCTGFVAARPVLDRLAPGTQLAGYDPKRPSGRGSTSVKWGMRAGAIYYLEREMVNYSTHGELLAERPRFVVTRGGYVDALTRSGYGPMIELREGQWLLARSAQGDENGPAAAQGTRRPATAPAGAGEAGR